MNLAVDYPWYLLLLAVLPFLWWAGLRSLSGLGNWRRLLALGLRSVVLTLIVFALAQLQWVKTSEKLTVLYLLDQSLSIPEPHRKAMSNYAAAEVAKHRNRSKEDRAGVIVFARQAAVEHPAVEDNLALSNSVESLVDPEYTDLAGALKLAQAMFPIDSAKRIVVVTDGNENLGNGLKQAEALAESGVGIDVVPVRYDSRIEVSVEKIQSPASIQRGQPFDLRIVLNNTATPGDPQAKPIRGTLKVIRRTKDREQDISEEVVSIEPGKRVFTVSENIDSADFYTYEARFIPEKPGDDVMPQNNQATAFTHVRGQGQVLLIEDGDVENRGEFDQFAAQLRKANLQVVIMPTTELFTSLADLQPYDTIVLANVPREAFSDDQIKMLANNTQQMGSGLVMLGGPNSFGAGGWTNSAVEEAMPVEFQIKSAKVVPTGALALVIDRSGSMEGEKIAMARAAAIAAVDVLSPKDYVSVSAFDSTAYDVVPMVKVERRASIKGRIHRLSGGGGTFMEPGIQMAYRSLKRPTDAAIRHMLILTDGQSSGSGYEAMVRRFRKEGITVSTVAVGADADVNLLQRMAINGGGKFYHATSPRMLPRIFQKEARMVSRPLVYEDKAGMQPNIAFPHEMLKGIEGGLPPITGYVLTELKQSPLVEVGLVAPKPASEENRTLLASWNYGLGKTVAFTSDAGRRWTKSWDGWSNQEKIFAQMIRWSMRPTDSNGNFSVNVAVKDGTAEVIVDALDKNDEFLDFLAMSARVVTPALKPQDLEIRQSAPGRYRGTFSAEDAGSYFITIVPGAGAAPIVLGLNVGYSREYLDRDTNEPLLATLAGLKPRGGEAGTVIDDEAHRGIAAAISTNKSGLEDLLAVDTFRRNLAQATSRQDIWPLLVLAAGCLFFGDVFVRRVRVNLAWIPEYVSSLARRIRGRAAVPEVATLNRLKGRKAEVAESLESRRAAVRFEPVSETPHAADLPLENLAAQQPVPSHQPSAASPKLAAESPAEDAYTSRLLKAKKKVWEERK